MEEKASRSLLALCMWLLAPLLMSPGCVIEKLAVSSCCVAASRFINACWKECLSGYEACCGEERCISSQAEDPALADSLPRGERGVLPVMLCAGWAGQGTPLPSTTADTLCPMQKNRFMMPCCHLQRMCKAKGELVEPLQAQEFMLGFLDLP